MKRKDLNETAFDLVQRATGQAAPSEDQRTAYQSVVNSWGGFHIDLHGKFLYDSKRYIQKRAGPDLNG